MGTYTIVARPDGAGYDIRVVAANGGRHTMLGFKTQAEIRTWIAIDEAADREAGDAPAVPRSDD